MRDSLPHTHSPPLGRFAKLQKRALRPPTPRTCLLLLPRPADPRAPPPQTPRRSSCTRGFAFIPHLLFPLNTDCPRRPAAVSHVPGGLSPSGLLKCSPECDFIKCTYSGSSETYLRGVKAAGRSLGNVSVWVVATVLERSDGDLAPGVSCHKPTSSRALSPPTSAGRTLSHGPPAPSNSAAP